MFFLVCIRTFVYLVFLVILCRTAENLFGHFTGDILQLSDYSGDFEESRLNEAKEIVLIAAGTGIRRDI